MALWNGRKGDGAMIDATVEIPKGWTLMDPPDGVALVASEPTPTRAVRANLVVNVVPQPVDGNPVPYLENVVAALVSTLEAAEVQQVWVMGHPGDPTFSQRLLIRYRLNNTAVDLIQQHTWIDGSVIVVSATASADLPAEEAHILNRCLDSVGLAA